MNDKFMEDSDKNAEQHKARIQSLASGLSFNPKRYEYKEHWVPAKTPLEVHSTAEMLEFLKQDKNLQLEARVLGWDGEGTRKVKVGREQFLEWSKRRDSKKLRESARQMKESWDDFGSGSDSSTIGKSDFTPLIGGPFDKQLYYRDYLRMIAASFYAFNHDPAAKAVVSVLVDFTMGRGFQLHADTPEAQVIWDAFVEANNFHEQMDYCALELSIYGETMWWWLPNNNARISWNPVVGERVPKAIIPRVRLIDPSNIAEIITVPEDINQGVLYYVWLATTQYQMYTRDNQPSSKFIYNQIPADQIMHTKVNSVSNEKRGRSDYFPSLGYMKRLRDGVNYALVAQQKAAAWCIDTTIQGDEEDINSYIEDQQDQARHTGIQTAGSEFVHTDAIKREYLANSATSKGGDSPVFSWCLNMIAMSSGVPISYLGTHLSGGSTRASAITSTEPVSKRFERRQLVYDRMIRRIFKRAIGAFGLESGCEIIFPQLITQDRSAMLKDLSLAQQNFWIAPSRAAEIANKEFDAKEFNYDTEMQTIKKDEEKLGISLQPGGNAMNPLTAPPAAKQNDGSVPSKGSAITAPEQQKVKNNLRKL